MPDSHDATVFLISDAMAPAVRALARAACQQLDIRVVEMRDAAAVVPPLRTDPLFVVAALPTGSRVVPPELGAWMARELPDVPLCLLTEESLVRPSVTLHGGLLHLVGAPLTELRLTAWLHALARARAASPGTPRDATTASLIGGRVHVRQQRVGPLTVGSVTHELPDATGPCAVVEATVCRGAAFGLLPRGREPADLTNSDGTPRTLDDAVTVAVFGPVRALRASVLRGDTELRLSSPDRAPRLLHLDAAMLRAGVELQLESRDVVLVSWPRGAIDDDVLGPLLLDGLQPTLCALELMNRVRPTAFAAVALQVR